MKCRPSRLRATGKGWVESEASGRIFRASEMISDVRQGRVHKTEADLTPGFGSWHPQDKKELPRIDDPSPVHEARPEKNADIVTFADLCITDADRLEALRTGCPLKVESAHGCMTPCSPPVVDPEPPETESLCNIPAPGTDYGPGDEFYDYDGWYALPSKSIVTIAESPTSGSETKTMRQYSTVGVAVRFDFATNTFLFDVNENTYAWGLDATWVGEVDYGLGRKPAGWDYTTINATLIGRNYPIGNLAGDYALFSYPHNVTYEESWLLFPYADEKKKAVGGNSLSENSVDSVLDDGINMPRRMTGYMKVQDNQNADSIKELWVQVRHTEGYYVYRFVDKNIPEPYKLVMLNESGGSILTYAWGRSGLWAIEPNGRYVWCTYYTLYRDSVVFSVKVTHDPREITLQVVVRSNDTIRTATSSAASNHGILCGVDYDGAELLQRVGSSGCLVDTTPTPIPIDWSEPDRDLSYQMYLDFVWAIFHVVSFYPDLDTAWYNQNIPQNRVGISGNSITLYNPGDEYVYEPDSQYDGASGYNAFVRYFLKGETDVVLSFNYARTGYVYGEGEFPGREGDFAVYFGPGKMGHSEWSPSQLYNLYARPDRQRGSYQENTLGSYLVNKVDPLTASIDYVDTYDVLDTVDSWGGGELLEYRLTKTVDDTTRIRIYRNGVLITDATPADPGSGDGISGNILPWGDEGTFCFHLDGKSESDEAGNRETRAILTNIEVKAWA